MRTVLTSNAEVAHVWASQSQAHGRTSNGNFSFDGRYLISYTTPIAFITTDINGNRCVIATTHRYSVTTSGKHQGQIWHACRHMDVFRVPVEITDRDTPASVAEKCRAQLWERARVAYAPARRDVRARRIAAYRGAVSAYNAFALAFGAPRVVLGPDCEIEADLAREASERARQEEEARAFRRAHTERFRSEAEMGLADWLAGRVDRIPHSEYLNSDHMRISPNNPAIVETTRGARVLTRAVRRVASRVLAMARSGQAWDMVEPVRLGHYELTRIDEEGTAYVGCHRFCKPELERFAAVLETAPEPVAVPAGWESID